MSCEDVMQILLCLEACMRLMCILCEKRNTNRALSECKTDIVTNQPSSKSKTVIVTNITEAIGKKPLLEFMRRGDRIVLGCRNLKKGRMVANQLRAEADGAGSIVLRYLNTATLDSVRVFANEVLNSEKAIYVLINNASSIPPDTRRVTADGLELTMAANHFGHFLLTNLLLGRLKESAPSRIINISSFVHTWAEFDANDLAISKPYSPERACYTSKLCNLLFTRELADRLTGTGVTANCFSPVFDYSGFFEPQNESSSSPNFAHITGEIVKTSGNTAIHLAMSEEVEGVTGRHFVDCKETLPSELARRKDLATSLWDASVKAVKLKQRERHC